MSVGGIPGIRWFVSLVVYFVDMQHPVYVS